MAINPPTLLEFVKIIIGFCTVDLSFYFYTFRVGIVMLSSLFYIAFN